MKNKLILPDRLKAVVSLIPKCNVLADIGTDHAYIPIHAVLNGIAKTSIAADVVEGPLKIAKQNINTYMLSEKISVVKSNGLKNIINADLIVIAGMGGTLIGEILEADTDKAKNASALVLQPMSCTYELRKKLHILGFMIDKEILVRDSGKIYTAMVVKKGQQQFDSNIQYEIGKYLIDTKPPLFNEYINHKISVYSKRILNMENSLNKQVRTEINSLKKTVEQLKGLM
ncbi:MAG: SAM-dependent methyltransferase [Clostridia bacterium]|nr:SAM-dependent methyltransferase [Clostridia bacterium]